MSLVRKQSLQLLYPLWEQRFGQIAELGKLEGFRPAKLKFSESSRWAETSGLLGSRLAMHLEPGHLTDGNVHRVVLLENSGGSADRRK